MEFGRGSLQQNWVVVTWKSKQQARPTAQVVYMTEHRIADLLQTNDAANAMRT